MSWVAIGNEDRGEDCSSPRLGVPGPGIYGRKRIELIRNHPNEYQRIKRFCLSIHLVLLSIIFTK